jgi:hypothetical protein
VWASADIGAEQANRERAASQQRCRGNDASGLHDGSPQHAAAFQRAGYRRTPFGRPADRPDHRRNVRVGST